MSERAGGTDMTRDVDWDRVYAEQLPRVYNFFRFRVVNRTREVGEGSRRMGDAGNGSVAVGTVGNGSTQSSAVEPASTPAARDAIGTGTTGVNGIASSSGSAAPPRFRVLAVTSADVPQEVLGTMIESFEETYGYSVERKIVSADEAACLRFNADVIVTLGRLSDASRTSCDRRGVRLTEVPIAYEAYVAVVHRENTWVDALTIEDLRMLDRMPYDTLTTWNQLRPSWPSLPITLFGLDSTNRTLGEYFVPSRGAPGSSITVHKNDTGVPNAVNAAYGGLGFMSFATYSSQSEAASKQSSFVPVKVLGIINQKGEIVMPSLKAIQDGSYDTLSRPLLLHFNVGQLDLEHVLLFGTHAVEGTSQRLREHGLMPIDKLSMDAAARKLRAASARR